MAEAEGVRNVDAEARLTRAFVERFALGILLR